MPSPPVRMILYQCSHELPDLRYQAPKKPSVLKRVKRALTFTEIIRTPSAELCPFCQRLEDEQAERDADKLVGLTRLAASPCQISPLLEHAVVIRRNNTVALSTPRTSPVTDTGSEADPQLVDPLPPRDPYRDTNMEDSTADYMEWRRAQSLADETPADRHARELRERLVRGEWRVMDAAREYKEFVLDQGEEPPQKPEPAADLSQLFSQAQKAPSPAPDAVSASPEPQQGSLRTRMGERKAEKALKADRVRNRAQEIAKK
ncbi:7387ace6-bf38-4fe3-a65f-e1fe30696dda [Sclerotinia trifoliorum]|uniref:7387ace6-bf38-4fe3-a65f-e1fe30696dda n=1 Tax=Sclerotinia trifoliorum TaxID=28548 RepID=A0A8H2ZTA0_9HELO|nr:7387ace6-bf38-4fe3-a65f-e1fe30696dda [Sclerotinia trifoliorum]